MESSNNRTKGNVKMDIDLFGKEIEYRDPNGNQITGRTKTGAFINNPLIPLYGIKEGEKCKNCAHLVRKAYSKVYYKCELRNNVDKCSPKSDHKVGWPACSKFESENLPIKK